MFDSKRFGKNVWYLLGATKGGPMRARVMAELISQPLNPNMLAQKIGVDYKTITHHLSVLLKNNWVTSSQQKYGELYYPTFTEEQRAVFMRVLGQIRKKS